jgi:hypothetical protein
VSTHENRVDYESDGNIDLYVNNYMSPNRLFRNDGGGAFTDVVDSSVNHVGSSTGSDWGDYDSDGDMDYTRMAAIENRIISFSLTAAVTLATPFI